MAAKLKTKTTEKRGDNYRLYEVTYRGSVVGWFGVARGAYAATDLEVMVGLADASEFVPHEFGKVDEDQYVAELAAAKNWRQVSAAIKGYVAREYARRGVA